MAPSPTGYVHLGSARTALFNLLHARHHGGRFVLRVDDTDLERNREEYEHAIYDGLRWLGLEWDEGPDVGGEAGPYRQSERLDLYRQHAVRLIESGAAYRCYCTVEELAEQRRRAEAERRPYVYDRRCLREPPADRLGKAAFAVRFRVPDDEVAFHDEVRGGLRFDTSLIGDFVIVKSDGYPTYNFASPVDDALMGITDVIRGEEHISNTPGQLLLLDAMGYERPRNYAHLPLILMPDRTKMSKRRHPEADLALYREAGYLPDAMVNYLALLGWNPGTEREIFSLDELVEVFDLSRVQKAGAVFDIRKLDSMDGEYIRRLTDAELAERLRPLLPELDSERLQTAVPALKERMAHLDQARELLAYLWEAPPEPAADGQGDKLRAVIEALEPVDWSPEAIEAALERLRESGSYSKAELFRPVRRALTKGNSPPIHYTLALLPRAEALARLRRASS
jgi:glutamyl-tRNA synthetase